MYSMYLNTLTSTKYTHTTNYFKWKLFTMSKRTYSVFRVILESGAKKIGHILKCAFNKKSTIFAQSL